MTAAFSDRLTEACRKLGPVCVGLDPVLAKLPQSLLGGDPVAAIESFSLGVIEATSETVGIVKPQIACFERYGAEGVAAYFRVCAAAQDAGMLVIADAKRGDIGVSSSHYASGFFEHAKADALTVNAYLGGDGLTPFIETAAKAGAGLFALVRTSNPGGDALQGLPLQDGRTVAEAVADLIDELGGAYLGESGYSLLGAVVGATKPADAESLRQRMPHQWFLVPGFGAQGGKADDVKACFNDDGLGAVITASRSIIYAFDPSDHDWKTAVRGAAQEMVSQIKAVVG